MELPTRLWEKGEKTKNRRRRRRSEIPWQYQRIRICLIFGWSIEADFSILRLSNLLDARINKKKPEHNGFYMSVRSDEF